MRVLQSKLIQAEKEKVMKERSDVVLSQVGSGERSEKIRTYNYAQDRVTDHRINFSHSLKEVVLAGKLEKITKYLLEKEKMDYLNSL